MTGYLDRRDPDVPPMTRERWIALAFAVAGAAAMLFIAVYASRVAFGLIGTIGRISPAAPLMFSTGAVLLMQREPAPDEAQPLVRPFRDRRIMAALFFTTGVVLIAAPFAFGGHA
jgi:hypothetical protein